MTNNFFARSLLSKSRGPTLMLAIAVLISAALELFKPGARKEQR